MSLDPSAREKNAALKRAIIGVKPDYFSWPPQVQEQYRASIPREDMFRIRQSLLKALFGITVTTEKQEAAAFSSFDDAQHVLFTGTMLPILGIGDDNFVMNEYLGDGVTLLDFPTLHDYDRFDHDFQERANKEDDPRYVIKPYRGCLYFRWAWLCVDGEFHYASLSMAAGYIASRIEEAGSEKIAELIPHKYVRGKTHGRREGRGTVFDMQVDARGMEAQLDELRHRFNCYMSERHEALLESFDNEAAKAVHIFDISRENDPHLQFVFSDRTALKNVRFRHFIKDCRALLSAGNTLALTETLARERRAAHDYLEKSCRDVVDNFDPKLARFRKKRKILIADGALEDLSKVKDD